MIQVLINRYEHRLDTYIKEIEEYCSKRNKNKTGQPPVSPSYLDEVIMPVFISLSENLPKNLGKFIVPDRKTYLPIKKYYRIRGVLIIGFIWFFFLRFWIWVFKNASVVVPTVHFWKHKYETLKRESKWNPIFRSSLKIGRKIVGGFLIPDGDSFNLYFVPLKSTIPIGGKVKIESIEQLIEIISDIIKKNKEKRYDK